jgi:hypothetical protein
MNCSYLNFESRVVSYKKRKMQKPWSLFFLGTVAHITKDRALIDRSNRGHHIALLFALKVRSHHMQTLRYPVMILFQSPSAPLSARIIHPPKSGSIA